MPRWSAAQMLGQIALGRPLKLREWPSDMHGQILPTQLKLREAIARGRISDVRGRQGPPGSKERIEELLSDSEFTLLVTPHGTLTVHPPHQRHKFEEKYGIDDLDNWWREIDFDQDEGEQAFAPSAPAESCRTQPHLRLLPGGLPARSGEIEAPGSEPAARAEELSPDPAAPPPRAEQKSPPAEPIRRGSPEQYDWEEGFLFMHQELNKRGDPKNPINAVDGWRSDADVARLVAAHVAIDGRQPDLKHTARVIRRRLKEWRAGQAEHNLVQVERN